MLIVVLILQIFESLGLLILGILYKTWDTEYDFIHLTVYSVLITFVMIGSFSEYLIAFTYLKIVVNFSNQKTTATVVNIVMWVLILIIFITVETDIILFANILTGFEKPDPTPKKTYTLRFIRAIR